MKNSWGKGAIETGSANRLDLRCFLNRTLIEAAQCRAGLGPDRRISDHGQFALPSPRRSLAFITSLSVDLSFGLPDILRRWDLCVRFNYLPSPAREGRNWLASRFNESSWPMMGAVCCRISLVISMEESSESKSSERMCSGVGIVTT